MDEVKKIEEVIKPIDQISYLHGKDLLPIHILDLFIRPKKFFTSQIALGKTPYLMFVTFIVGISSAIERTNKQLMKATYSDRPGLSEFLGHITDSWFTFWPFIITLGAINAYFLYLIGGWWYNKRLKWCGSLDHEKKTGRVVYIYTSFIIAFPFLLYTLFQVPFYTNYTEAYYSESLLSILIIIFPFWAVCNSYRAVNIVFEVQKNKAKMWFLILPTIVYIISFGVAATLLGYLDHLNVGSI